MDTTKTTYAIMVARPYGPRQELMPSLEDGRYLLNFDNGLYYVTYLTVGVI